MHLLHIYSSSHHLPSSFCFFSQEHRKTKLNAKRGKEPSRLNTSLKRMISEEVWVCEVIFFCIFFFCFSIFSFCDSCLSEFVPIAPGNRERGGDGRDSGTIDLVGLSEQMKHVHRTWNIVQCMKITVQS